MRTKYAYLLEDVLLKQFIFRKKSAKAPDSILKWTMYHDEDFGEQ
jgi:hypothetical protein